MNAPIGDYQKWSVDSGVESPYLRRYGSHPHDVANIGSNRIATTNDNLSPTGWELQALPRKLHKAPLFRKSFSFGDLLTKEKVQLQFPVKKQVFFARTEIREYNVTIGDHPSCQDGLPISLDWEYSKKLTYRDIRESKVREKGYKFPKRLSYADRRRMLGIVEVSAFTEEHVRSEEIQAVIKLLHYSWSQNCILPMPNLIDLDGDDDDDDDSVEEFSAKEFERDCAEIFWKRNLSSKDIYDDDKSVEEFSSKDGERCCVEMHWKRNLNPTSISDEDDESVEEFSSKDLKKECDVIHWTRNVISKSTRDDDDNTSVKEEFKFKDLESVHDAEQWKRDLIPKEGAHNDIQRQTSMRFSHGTAKKRNKNVRSQDTHKTKKMAKRDRIKHIPKHVVIKPRGSRNNDEIVVHWKRTEFV